MNAGLQSETIEHSRNTIPEILLSKIVLVKELSINGLIMKRANSCRIFCKVTGDIRSQNPILEICGLLPLRLLPNKSNNNKTCKHIDMALPSDRNTSLQTTGKKISKYKDLEIETTRMWPVQTEIIPVVIGALGLIKKGLEKHTAKIPGIININELHNKITSLIKNSPYRTGFALKAKFISPHYALGPWFGPGPFKSIQHNQRQEFT